MSIIRHLIYYFNLFCLGYTLVLSFLYIVQLFISYLCIRHNFKRRPANDYIEYLDSDNLPPVSLLIPAYNEQENIVGNIEALLGIDYPEFELIVVNDGSNDQTHERVINAFGLYEIDYTMKVSIPIKKVHGVYYNPQYPNLIYVNKENGGKSDALNAGINMSVYPLFVCLDADSRLEHDAILRLASEFVRDSKTVVAGGFVRIANGSVIENGRWKSFEVPDKAVERFQIVEYFRSFLAGRVSWCLSNSLLIVSGAFGMFKKQTVINCGGYKTKTIGEDMEVVVNIHEQLRKNKRKYRIVFCEEAVCWTQGPMSLRDLRNQRRRWQIGMMDSLLHHKKMIFNPRYGVTGLFSVPYNWAFELLGAPIEIIGYLLIPLSLFLGELSLIFFLIYLLIAVSLGIILSFGGLILEQRIRYGRMSAKQCLRLSRYAVLENLGYRQFITLFRVEGMLKYRSLRRSWGRIKRKQFNT